MKSQLLSTWLSRCINLIMDIRGLYQMPYSLEQINADTGEVVIHCRGSRAFIKSTLNDVMLSPHIIQGLPSIHACWIGYYYSVISSKKEMRFKKYPEFSFNDFSKNKRYKIISLDMRTMVLTVQDTKINRTYKEKITAVSQDHTIMSNIDPMQACYIGIQVGYIEIKYGRSIFNKENNKPILKIV